MMENVLSKTHWKFCNMNLILFAVKMDKSNVVVTSCSCE